MRRGSPRWLYWPCPALSLAHPERPSYWPNPRPDTSVSPPAGGEVPQARTLVSAVTGKGPGDVNVVCKGETGQKSMALLDASLQHAQRVGFRLRPSQPKTFYTAGEAGHLRWINQPAGQAMRLPLGAARPSTNPATTIGS